MLLFFYFNIKNMVSRATASLDGLVLIANVDDSLVPIANPSVTHDFLDVIGYIFYEVAESKATTVVSLRLERAVEYLNDNGRLTKEILEIPELEISSYI
jgi:hypothetical protein